MALITDNLASVWRFDDTNWQDAYGTNHLTNNGTVVTASGKVGSGASFSGSAAQSLSIASNASLAINAAAGTTWTMWVKPTSLAASGALIGKDATGAREYGLNLNSDGVVSGFVFGGGGEFGNANTTLTGPAVTVGNWSFVAFWWSAADGKVRVKVDGGTTAESIGTITPITTSTPLRFGNRDIAAFPVNAVIDEVCLWHRVLTDAERAAVRNIGLAGWSVADLAGSVSTGGIGWPLVRRIAALGNVNLVRA